jgi:hypothetical protein
MENEARYDGAKLIKRIENEAKEEAEKKPRKFLPPPSSGMPPIMWPNERFLWFNCPAMR